MSDHLPECVDAMIPDFHNERWVCICAALRSCEERMLNDDIPAAAYHGQKCYEIGYAAGLDDAREAVKGVNWFNDEGKMLSAVVATADSIAAIDALKEQR